MKASDFMTKDVKTCTIDQTVQDAANLMLENDFSVVPIVDAQGKLLGVITESDFISREVKIPHAMASLKHLFGQNFNSTDVEDIYKKAKTLTLDQVMTKDVKTCTPDESLNSVVSKMSEKNIKRLPVIDNGKLVGIITRKNILKAFNSLNI
jgi:CBS domain-containing protein